MVSLAAALRELRGPRSQQAMAKLLGRHLRCYNRLEQESGANCRFATIQHILDRTAAPPQTRAIICSAWIREQIGEVNFKAVHSQLKSMPIS